VPVFKKSSPLGRLGSGSRVVGRLRSGVWVSASFQKVLAFGSVRVRITRRGSVKVRSVG